MHGHSQGGCLPDSVICYPYRPPCHQSFICGPKNHEVVDKFDPEHQVVSSDDNFCIFFINADHPTGNKRACNFVIYGSGVLAGCALLMITFLAVRIGYFSIKLVIAIASSCIAGLGIGPPAN